MKSMVRFRARDGSYAVPVHCVRRVGAADRLSRLPSGRSGVAGVLKDGDLALPVLSVLGSEGGRVLVLEAGGRRFGLLVEDVIGVAEVDELRLGPPPEGQVAGLVTVVLDAGPDIVLILDPVALGRQVLD